MRYFLYFVIFLATHAFGLSFVHADPIVYNVRVGVHPDKTRFVLDLSKEIKFQIEHLIDPYRLVVNLPTVNWQVPTTSFPKRKYGLIKNWRHGYFTFKKFDYRIVIDLKGPANLVNSYGTY